MQFGVCQTRLNSSVGVIAAKRKHDCDGLTYPFWADSKMLVDGVLG